MKPLQSKAGGYRTITHDQSKCEKTKTGPKYLMTIPSFHLKRNQTQTQPEKSTAGPAVRTGSKVLLYYRHLRECMLSC